MKPKRSRKTFPTPSTAELSKFAGGIVCSIMNEGIKTRKHRAGGWNEGAESDPRWHLFRCARHALDAIALLDGVSRDNRETAIEHAIRSLARAVLASYQLIEQEQGESLYDG